MSYENYPDQEFIKWLRAGVAKIMVEEFEKAFGHTPDAPPTEAVDSVIDVIMSSNLKKGIVPKKASEFHASVRRYVWAFLQSDNN